MSATPPSAQRGAVSEGPRHAHAAPGDAGMFAVVFGARDSSGEETFSVTLLETFLLEEAMDCFAQAKFDLVSYWSCGRSVYGDERMARVSFFARLEKGGHVVDAASYGRNEFVRNAGGRPARARRMVKA